ncbi:MAG: M55 family metallopeptidase [Victivallaceae bacterium]|nr:M55 family metallopeptidase [Victivallaceae bacterium]
MKIYIMADMEGVSGVTGDTFVGGPFADEGRKLLTADVNACAAACFESGAETVVVRDGHSTGFNMRPGEVDPRVELVQGATGLTRFAGIKGSDAMILLGYHAMAGTPGAILEHTFSSKTIQNMWYNGRKVGEAGIDAMIAGEYGVPVIMISGDDKLCAEAGDWLPEAVKCRVKTGLGCNAGHTLPLVAAHRMIADCTAAAIAKISGIRPLVPQYPVTLRWENVERCPVPLAGATVIDGRTFEKSGDNLERLLLG